MKFEIKWKCDKCGLENPVTYEYDWIVGLGDIWPPFPFSGYGEEILCEGCYQKAWYADFEEYPDEVWTA